MAEEHVTIVSPCPDCGRDCTWTGTPREPGGGTTWRILCGCSGE